MFESLALLLKGKIILTINRTGAHGLTGWRLVNARGGGVFEPASGALPSAGLKPEGVRVILRRWIYWLSTVLARLLHLARKKHRASSQGSNGEQGKDEAHPGCCRRRGRRWWLRAGAVQRGYSIFEDDVDDEAVQTTGCSTPSGSVFGSHPAPGCLAPPLFEHEGSLTV